MSPWQLALLCGALVTLFLSMRLPRAWLWIFMAALSFILSTAYARMDWPYPAHFTAGCDIMVCLSVYFFGRRQWEMMIWRLFQLSVGISLLYIARLIGPHWAYVVSLELVNWALLLMISGAGIVQWVAVNGGSSFYWRMRGLRVVNRALSAQRAQPAFHKARK